MLSIYDTFICAKKEKKEWERERKNTQDKYTEKTSTELDVYGCFRTACNCFRLFCWNNNVIKWITYTFGQLKLNQLLNFQPTDLLIEDSDHSKFFVQDHVQHNRNKNLMFQT